jgi:hypothetical protein
MPKHWTADQLARDCRVVACTILLVMSFIRLMNWITVNQGIALLAIGLSFGLASRLISWRIRKPAAHSRAL